MEFQLRPAMLLGRVEFPRGRHPAITPGQYCDFHAVNYYSRSTVSGPANGVAESCPVNDLGWEIYPAGIVECARKVYNILPRPIWVTENGTCDNFAWIEGNSARFGLVHVDYDTQRRTVKPSGAFYCQIIENGGVTQEMWERYCEGEYPRG